MTDLPTINAAELPDPGEVPVLDWIDVALIYADPLFQRPLDDKRVETILKAFSWKSFGAIVVAPRADGRFSVTDGQHRAEAAKLHPKVSHVPAIVIAVPDVPAEAGVFVDINRNRKNVTALELFFAQLATGSGEAELVLAVTRKAGIRIPKYASAGMKPNDTIAVSAIQGLLRQRGAELGEDVLDIVAAGGFAPITAAQIKAVECLLTDPEYRGQVAGEDLKALIGSAGKTLDGDAKRFAATHCCPAWKGLASVWFQKCRKRGGRGAQNRGGAHDTLQNSGAAHAFPPRAPAPAAPPARSVPHPSVAWDMSRPASRGVPVTASIMGDPEPGRSALDQRGQA